MQEQNLELNHVIVVSLLSACSHYNMLDVGIQLFELMVSKHKILPLVKHYACIAYLFGCGGFFHLAKRFISNMPFEIYASIWIVFLVACKLHASLELAQLARKKLDGMLCEDNPTLILGSNKYTL